MTFLRNCWQVAAYGREGRPHHDARITNEPLILFRAARGNKEMLEAQQANFGSGDFDPAYPMAVKADAGAVAGRRLLHAFIEAEARAAAA